MRSPHQIVVVASIIVLTLVLCRWTQAGGNDFSHFILIGENRVVDASQLPESIKINKSGGYDGQYFYRLALDPFTTEPIDFGLQLERPAYRQQRILYPLLSWASAFGVERLVPSAMVLVNALALIGICFFLAKIAILSGAPLIWGLAPVLYAGFCMSLGRSLAEPTTGLFFMLAILGLLKGKLFLYAVAMSLAVLARESSLVFAVACAPVVFTDWKGRRICPWKLFCLALPGVVFVGWQIVLFDRWGIFPFANSPANTGLPGVGFVSQLIFLPLLSKPFESVVQLLNIAWLGWLGWEVYKISFRNRNDGLLLSETITKTKRWLKFAWLLWGVVAACLSRLIWEDDWSFMRVLSDWVLIGFVLLVLEGKAPNWKFVCFSVVIFSGAFLRLSLRA